MDIQIFYEVSGLILIITRLSMLRKETARKCKYKNYLYWAGMFISCSIIMRLSDGRMTASSLHIAIIIFIVLLLWLKEILKN